MTRLLTKKVPYTVNRAGYYYLHRRVPADLLSHYSYPRIVQGLKTKSAQIAKSKALVADKPFRSSEHPDCDKLEINANLSRFFDTRTDTCH